MVEGRGRRMKADQWVDERYLDFCVLVWVFGLGKERKGSGFYMDICDIGRWLGLWFK
jgi:hypothetical protein